MHIFHLEYEQITNVLSSRKSKNDDQEFIWQVIYEWVEANKKPRIKFLLNLLLNYLQFNCLTEQFVENNILNNLIFDEIKEDLQKLKIFLKNINFQPISNKQTNQNNNNSTIVSNLFFPTNICSEKTKNVIVNVDRYDGSVKFYDDQQNCWYSTSLNFKPPIKQSFFDLQLIEKNNKNFIFIFGGNGYSKTIDKVWSRDFNNPLCQWTSMKSMNSSRKDFSSVVLNEYIYVLGGCSKTDFSEQKTLNSCERYDYKKNYWSAIDSMKIARKKASAIVYKNNIYIAGGVNDEGVIEKSVEKYDTQLEKWSSVTQMLTARCEFAFVFYDNCFWAIGGYDNQKPLACVESFDPIKEIWQTKAKLNENRYCHGSIEYNNELYVIGGFPNISKLNINFVKNKQSLNYYKIF